MKYFFGFEDCYLYCMLGALVFTGYVLLDLWFILRGMDTICYTVADADDYIIAVLAIYLDIIFIYIYMVKALNDG